MKRKYKHYVHSDKDDNSCIATNLGIKNKNAKNRFRYTAYEVELIGTVNTLTGQVVIDEIQCGEGNKSKLLVPIKLN